MANRTTRVTADFPNPPIQEGAGRTSPQVDGPALEWNEGAFVRCSDPVLLKTGLFGWFADVGGGTPGTWKPLYLSAGQQSIPRLANIAAMTALPTVDYAANAAHLCEVLSVGDFWKFDPTVTVLAWNSGTAYVVGDLVTLANVTYVAVAAGTNHTPPNLAFWAVSMERVGSNDGLGSWVRLLIPNKAFQLVAAWTIDPAGGSDEGTTTLQTRSEFARRTNNQGLTQNVTVTINSSLNLGDTRMPNVKGAVQGSASGFQVSYVGVPTSLFSNTISGYVPRNGATAQVTTMTLASLPVSWTLSGLVNKIIEYTDGAGHFVRSVVVADLGAKTAWLSPPITEAFLESVFTVGNTITVWDMPSLGTVEQTVTAQSEKYTYLSATSWELFDGTVVQFICCVSTSISLCAGGSDAVLVSCFFNELLCRGGQGVVNGGMGKYIADQLGDIRFNLAATVFSTSTNVDSDQGVKAIASGHISTPGTTSVRADIEFSGAAPAVRTSLLSGGRINLDGYLYGTATSGTNVVEIRGRDSAVSLAKIPAITGASAIAFDVDVVTGAASDLAFTDLRDTQGNSVEGPAGPVTSGANGAINGSGGTIPSFRIVRSNGTSGQVTTAQADTAAHAANILGVTTFSSAAAAKLILAPCGLVPIQFDGPITLGLAYLSSTTTDGQATSTPPALSIPVGTVETDLGGNIGLVNLGAAFAASTAIPRVATIALLAAIGTAGYSATQSHFAEVLSVGDVFKHSPSGGRGTYSGATAYVIGDFVFYPTTGKGYRAIAAGTGNLPTNTAFWVIDMERIASAVGTSLWSRIGIPNRDFLAANFWAVGSAGDDEAVGWGTTQVAADAVPLRTEAELNRRLVGARYGDPGHATFPIFHILDSVTDHTVLTNVQTTNGNAFPVMLGKLPTPTFSGIVTAYAAAVPAANTGFLLSATGLGAGGNLGLMVQNAAGTKTAFIVANPTGNQVRVTEPRSSDPVAGTQGVRVAFTVGETINVYTLLTIPQYPFGSNGLFFGVGNLEMQGHIVTGVFDQATLGSSSPFIMNCKFNGIVLQGGSEGVIGNVLFANHESILRHGSWELHGGGIYNAQLDLFGGIYETWESATVQNGLIAATLRAEMSLDNDTGLFDNPSAPLHCFSVASLRASGTVFGTGNTGLILNAVSGSSCSLPKATCTVVTSAVHPISLAGVSYDYADIPISDLLTQSTVND